MPQLKIIRASAGSGKTFTLAQEYLRLLFSERDNFMHILAVTFTNKATEEMKTRIIRELHLLSTGQPSLQLEVLLQITGLPEKQIRSRATGILRRLLHNYSRFSVSTIDAFFQRIIRGFTRELGIQSGYTLELDTETLLTETIRRLLRHAETDRSLLNWLTRFAESLIEKGESWDIRKGIRALGSEIFKEAFRSIDENDLRHYSDRDFLQAYQRELNAIITRTEKQTRNLGQQTRALLEKARLTVDDFSGKSRGPAGFLLKLETGEFREPTPTAMAAAIHAEKWHTAVSPIREQIAELARRELMPLMQQVIAFYEANRKSYFTAGVILRNLYTLGILTDLSRLADTWCAENNTFLLSGAPVFLNRIIDGNDTPFIYEKAGYWYHHYMIDEFQDTSLVQWLNFKPLISNSLSQNYDNLTVGDAKQSIYRWRNSSWDILESQINEDFLPGVLHPVTLTSNWRSRFEIIEFNNRFFAKAAEILENAYEQSLEDLGGRSADAPPPMIRDLYKNTVQQPGDPKNTGGYVQVDCLPADTGQEYDDLLCKRLVDLLCSLQDQGFQLGDIAILTRKNREANILADFLLQYANENPGSGYRFDVISDEALRLGSSILVTFLVACLQQMITPNDLTNNYLQQWLRNTYLAPADDEAWQEYEACRRSQGSLSLTEITERLILVFKLDAYAGERVYLHAFRDLISDFTRRNNSDINRFLEFWQDTGKEKSVAAPAHQNAIRILTIHKAKGLEFKIVIIPYCTWELHAYQDVYLWCKPQTSPFNQVSLLPLGFSSSLKYTIFAREYYFEFQRQYIDNLNLLYVAFTRARDGLFVMCRAKENEQVSNVSDLVRRVTQSANFQTGTLVKGISVPPSGFTRESYFQPVTVNQVANRIKIAWQGRSFLDPSAACPARPIHEGKILHEIFKAIQGDGDVMNAVNRMLQKGLISVKDRDRYLKMVEDALQLPEVSDWFSKNWKVLTEAEIILPRGGMKRPDRVMMQAGRTLVIDYKFGSVMEAAHEKQVKEYAAILQAMGHEQVEAWLWYVRMGRVVRL